MDFLKYLENKCLFVLFQYNIIKKCSSKFGCEEYSKLMTMFIATYANYITTWRCGELVKDLVCSYGGYFQFVTSYICNLLHV